MWPMHLATRLALLLLLIVVETSFGKSSAKDAEYKRADANFYLQTDVLRAEPKAVIVPSGSYIHKGDSYFLPARPKPAKDIYIQVTNDWIEPITPPDMPASLGVAADVMQIREPQGDVQVALPSAPANFVPATDGMTIPNGSVIKTGDGGTAAVLFGGVDSARFTPHSEAAVQQTVTPQLRSTEIDLKSGAVFSKVGQRIGEKQDYEVKTPFGVAAARGTDFVTVAMPARTDVWVAQGVVQMNQPDGKLAGTVRSDGQGALKIIRFPAMKDMHDAMMAGAETMTAAMDFIPTINMKVKALRDQMAQGVKLSARQMDYLGRIKKVPCLIKLALVEPPAPPAPAPPPPPPPAPAVKAPAPGVPAAAESTKVINLTIHPDGKVIFRGALLHPDELKSKLEAIGETTPTQPFVIKAGKNVAYDHVKKILDMCHDAHLNDVTVTAANATPPPESPQPAPGAAAPTPAASVTPKPATPVAPEIKANPTMTPRPTEPAAPSSAPPKKKSVKKSEPTSSPAPAAPAESGPNDTVP